jgi:hypothetical protein
MRELPPGEAVEDGQNKRGTCKSEKTNGQEMRSPFHGWGRPEKGCSIHLFSLLASVSSKLHWPFIIL